jgi:hypothetical protein
MSDDIPKPGPTAEAEIEREIRLGRKFTPQEALGRMAGPGAMKGASAVSPQQQAEIAVGTWLRGHLSDAAGALRIVLERHLKGSRALLDNVDRPLAAVGALCGRVLSSESLLRELVRETDVEWARMMDERPIFEREGATPDPGDPYTLESVRNALSQALAGLNNAGA